MRRFTDEHGLSKYVAETKKRIMRDNHPMARFFRYMVSMCACVFYKGVLPCRNMIINFHESTSLFFADVSLQA